jgi:ATP-binding cassette subfamily B multidrug efflux pump
MAWNKKKHGDGADELFAENARIERERKEGAIEDAQAMTPDVTSEDELEVPKDTWGTVRRLWDAARGERWRFGVVVAAILVYTGFHVPPTAPTSSTSCGRTSRLRLPRAAPSR